ncbi:MAG: hypothetical protein ACLRFP_03185 [Alphaproteobacteria bacterium]
MNEIEKQYARTFATPAGKEILKHLRTLTTERIIGQNVSNDELRWWAAQCALVHQIENFIKRGNNPT